MTQYFIEVNILKRTIRCLKDALLKIAEISVIMFTFFICDWKRGGTREKLEDARNGKFIEQYVIFFIKHVRE